MLPFFKVCTLKHTFNMLQRNYKQRDSFPQTLFLKVAFNSNPLNEILCIKSFICINVYKDFLRLH